MIVPRFLLILALAQTGAAGIGDRLGSKLKPGMQLIYSSGGTETPWTIDSVLFRPAPDGKRCINVTLRMSPSQATPENRVQCTDGVAITSWDEQTKAHRPLRPLSPGALVLPRASGSTRYEAAPASVDTVSGIALTVVPTVIFTIDSTGTEIRRLRERFAIELATATSGVFEVRDSAAASGWRAVREFKLTAIR